MTVRDLLIVAAAGLISGAVNAGAGGGTLVTFPVLLGLGLTPLSANVTTTFSAVAGQIGATLGQRVELEGQRQRVMQVSIPVAIGSLVGAVILLTTPPSVFRTIVPGLIALACLALLAQPRLTRLAGGHGGEASAWLRTGLFLAGVYGAYFGAALGIMLLALLSFAIDDTLHRLNAVKVVLGGLASAVAAIVYAILGPVRWPLALTLGIGAIIGGRLGAVVVRRIPPAALRVAVAVIGLAVAVSLALSR